MTKPPLVYRVAEHEPSLRIPDEVTGDVHVVFGPKERRNGSPAFVIEIGGQPIDLLILSELQNGAAERSIGIELRWLDAPSPISSSRDFGHLMKYGGGASALSSLTFARKVGPISGESRELEAQFELTDRDGVLASSPVPLIVEQAKVCLTQSLYGNVAHEYVVVDGPVILRNANFELESNGRDSISLLRCEAEARPGFYVLSGFCGRALDVEIQEGQTLALMDPTWCRSLCLEDRSVVLVADGTHIQEIEGTQSSAVKVLLPDDGATKAVRVDAVASVSIGFAGDSARNAGMAEFHVRGRAANVAFSNRMMGAHRATVSFAEGAVGQDLSFDHGGRPGEHVTLQTGEGSRLSGVSGTVAVTSLRGSMRGAEEDGFSICRFMDTSPESQPFYDAEITNLRVQEPPDARGRQIVDSARAAKGFTPHLKTWDAQNRTARVWPWIKDTYEHRRDADRSAETIRSNPLAPLFAVWSRNELWEQDLGFTDDLSTTVHEKSRDAAARCEAQIAVLNARQLCAVKRSERLLLLVGRSVGYGQRLGRPILAGIGVAFIATVAMNFGQPPNFSSESFISFLEEFSTVAQSPVGLLPGVETSAEEPPHWFWQLSVAVPFAAFLLAIRNRTRWTKD